jgi:hypothetical protein
MFYNLGSLCRSKRTAACGTPLINVMICPDDSTAVAWRIVDASGQIKDTAYVVQLHCDLRGEIEAAVPNGHFLGYVMDSTATNRAAMRILQQEDRTIVVLPCIAHALSNLIKHAAKNFVWIDKVYSACCTISEKLIASPKLRTVLQEIQEEEYNEVRGICAHVPTRFGSRHMVMRDLLHSRTAIRRLAAKAEWRASVQDSAGMKKAHELINALEDDLFELADKLEVLLGPVMDAIHQLEADQPMLSFIKPMWGKLQKHFAQFSADHPDEAEGEIPADRRKRNPQPTPSRFFSCLSRTASSCGTLPWMQPQCWTLSFGRRMCASSIMCLLHHSMKMIA